MCYDGAMLFSFFISRQLCIVLRDLELPLSKIPFALLRCSNHSSYWKQMRFVLCSALGTMCLEARNRLSHLIGYHWCTRVLVVSVRYSASHLLLPLLLWIPKQTEKMSHLILMFSEQRCVRSPLAIRFAMIGGPRFKIQSMAASHNSHSNAILIQNSKFRNMTVETWQPLCTGGVEGASACEYITSFLFLSVPGPGIDHTSGWGSVVECDWWAG